MTVVDFKAAQKWANVPNNMKELLLNNVFCSSCGVTTIVKYTILDHDLGVLLNGKCKSRGKNVARLVEL